ncbi:MAG TPA: hypothetical protein VFA95_05870 [Gammaproteobacteria bacterium]|nr:hypothetical protein [Gammaproteobacteria bacterium]
MTATNGGWPETAKPLLLLPDFPTGLRADRPHHVKSALPLIPADGRSVGKAGPFDHETVIAEPLAPA